MTKDQAKQLVYSELDFIRAETSKLGREFHQAESLDRWIATASKKELFAQIIFLLANNHKN